LPLSFGGSREMGCRGFERSIALHVEGDLSRRRAQRLERHLADCAACRAFAEDMAASQAAVKALGHRELGEADLAEVRRHVLAAASETAAVRRGGAHYRRVAWVAATMAAVAVVVVLVGLNVRQAYELQHVVVQTQSEPEDVPPTHVVSSQDGERVPSQSRPRQSPSAHAPQFAQNGHAPGPGPAELPPLGHEPTKAASTPPEHETEPPPIIIKLVTDNPDVVILLLANGKEKSHAEPADNHAT